MVQGLIQQVVASLSCPRDRRRTQLQALEEAIPVIFGDSPEVVGQVARLLLVAKARAEAQGCAHVD